MVNVDRPKSLLASIAWVYDLLFISIDDGIGAKVRESGLNSCSNIICINDGCLIGSFLTIELASFGLIPWISKCNRASPKL